MENTMKVQLNKTVKATIGISETGNPIKTTWPKGKVFDDAVGPIPEPIMRMATEKSPLVAVMEFGTPDKIDSMPEFLDQTSTIVELEARIIELETRIAELEGNEPFGCPVCGKEFPSQRGLKGHITKMHPGHDAEVA